MFKPKSFFVIGVMGVGLIALVAGLATMKASAPDDKAKVSVPADAIVDKGSGFTQPMHVSEAGSVTVDRRVQVHYLLALRKSPNLRQMGSMLSFAPPVDFERNAEGLPIVFVGDPKRGGPFRFKKDGQEKETVLATPSRAKTLICRVRAARIPVKMAGANPANQGCWSTSEVAKAVQDGSLTPETKVSVTIKLRLHQSENLRKKIYEAFYSRFKNQVENSDASTPIYSGNWDRARDSVDWLIVRELRVTAVNTGLEQVAFVMGKNSALRDPMLLNAEVPALFLSKMYSDEGLQLNAEFWVDTFQSNYSMGTVRKTVEDALYETLKGSSLGHLKDDVKNGLIEILATREQVQTRRRTSNWRDSINVIGNADTINVILQLLQRMDTDVFGVTEDQVVNWMKEHQLTREELQKPGIANSLEKLSQNEQFSDKEVEAFKSLAKTWQKSGQGGGGLSLFGIGSIGGGGGSSDAGSEASKVQNRHALQQFVKDLNVYRTTGNFPVHPKGKYCIVSSQALRRAVEQDVAIQLGSSIKTIPLSSPFSSKEPTLKDPPADAIAEILQKIYENHVVAKQALEKASAGEGQLQALESLKKQYEDRLVQLESGTMPANRLRKEVSASDECHINNDKWVPLKDMKLEFRIEDKRPRSALVVFKSGGVSSTTFNKNHDARCILQLMVDGKPQAVTHLEFNRANVEDTREAKDARLIWLWENIPAGDHVIRIDCQKSGGGTRVSRFGSTRSLAVIEIP